MGDEILPKWQNGKHSVALAQYFRGCVAWVGVGEWDSGLFLIILEMEFEMGVFSVEGKAYWGAQLGTGYRSLFSPL